MIFLHEEETNENYFKKMIRKRKSSSDNYGKTKTDVKAIITERFRYIQFHLKISQENGDRPLANPDTVHIRCRTSRGPAKRR